jgi:hypothetical protein
MWTKLSYPIYVKDTNLDVHIQIFKKAIKTEDKKINEDIINLFGFMFKENISKHGENFVQNHHNHTFVKLEHAFCKKYLVEKNDEHIYMKLQSINKKIMNRWKFITIFFEVKASYLHIKAINTYLIIFFVMGLHPYFQLSTTKMKQNDLIKHKEIVVICQKNGPKGYK